VRAYTFGIYPRPLRLIAATRRDPEGSRELARSESRRIIGLQERAGLPLLSDPLLEWDDMLRWFALEWRGVRADGILRYFEHNAFYRVPVVEGELGTDGGVLRRHLVIGARGRAVLEVPEPLTFALMSRDSHYGSLEALTSAIARALNEELCSAEGEIGPALIAVKGPALVHGEARGRLDLAARASFELLDSCRAPALLHLYFKSPLGAYRELSGMRSAYAGFALDATRDDRGRLAEGLRGYKMSELALGLVDAQNTRVEGVEELAGAAEALGRAAGVEAMVTVSSDLEFLPYSFAMRKVRVLGRLARHA
jgi:5-methyltetrahydropteroyltriglutamate--homocysteine methyltransferase